VLKQMLDTRSINKEVYQQAVSTPYIKPNQIDSRIKAPYFVEYVRKELEEELGYSLLYKGGLTIFTTLSHEKQKFAEDAVEKGLAALETRMKNHKLKDPNPQCALVSLDIKTGGISAMVGGRDFFTTPFNRAVSAKRQPGSAFKPILYACAIEKGFRQNELILDAPVVFKIGNNRANWRPENFSKKFHGEITLRKALALSENIPAVKLIEKIGPSYVVSFGQTFGIESSLSPNLSLALGTSEVTLLELTSAYTVFPNQGKHIKPYGVLKVLDDNGRILLRHKPEKSIIMSRAGAAIMTDMLQAVIRNGTGKKAAGLNHPLGGKTGTTNDYKDALFVGFSPSIATGVWVGQDRYLTLGKYETGAKAALPVWISYMEECLKNSPAESFDHPDDVTGVAIDPETGLLPMDDTTSTITVLFKKGTEPTRQQ